MVVLSHHQNRLVGRNWLVPLAGFIELKGTRVIEDGDRATVTAQVRLPDANASAVSEIIRKAGGDGADVAALQNSLDGLLQSGQISFLEEEQIFELRRESNRWGVYASLDEAVQVNFSAAVQAGLPWLFEPLQSSARLLLGDGLHAQFLIKNDSEQTLTGKANVDTSPAELADHLYFLQCFCLVQLTLRPGEEQTLGIAVTLVEPLADDQQNLRVHYDFYPNEDFPASEESNKHTEGDSHG